MSAMNDFKYNIDDVLIDEKRKLKIIRRKRDRDKAGNLYKYYQYRCLKCGWDCSLHYNPKTDNYVDNLWITQSGLYNKKSGCLCCNGDVVVKDKNSLLCKYPEIRRFLVNIEDGYTHTFQSNKKILCKCDKCGNVKLYKVNNLVNKGFSCEKCSDGISYPEKIMMSILLQLNINYVYQLSKKNSNRTFLYDFYFTKNNEKYVIEINGIQHYKETKFTYSNKRSLQDELINDKNKMNFAIKNGIKKENYIIIDARKSDLSYIKLNILNSKLSDIFNLTIINWEKCDEFAATSILIKICNYWKDNSDHVTTLDSSQKYKFSRSTIIKYLKRGHNIGLCIYDSQKEKEKNYAEMRKLNTHGKTVEILKDGISYGIFINCRELARQSIELFGVQMNSKKISAVCTGIQKTHKGYSFRYIQQYDESEV